MLKKFYLILLSLCLINSPIHADWKDNVAFYIRKISNATNLGVTVLPIAILPIALFCYKKEIVYQSGKFVYINELKDAPEEVVRWCKLILQKHEIQNIDSIKFKINVNVIMPWGTYKNKIVIDENIVHELQELLNNNDQEKLSFHEFFLLHEVKHIINKDSLKCCFMPAVVSISSYIVLELLEKILFKSLNIKNSTSLKFILIRNEINGLFKLFLAKYLLTKYLRYTENEADKFAIQKLLTKGNIGAINSCKILLEKEYQDFEYLLQVSKKDFEEKLKETVDENVRKAEMKRLKRFFAFREVIYKIFEKPDNCQTFLEWIKEMPKLLRMLHWHIDPSHHFYEDRINTIEQLVNAN